MSTAATNDPLNLAQLAGEVGTDALSTATEDGTTTVSCHAPGYTDAQLQAAVDAHEPAPPPPTPEALLQRQINELTDLIIFGL